MYKNIIYAAVVLDDESRAKLQKYARDGQRVYCEHLTLGFGDKVCGFHEWLAGHPATLHVTRVVVADSLVLVQVSEDCRKFGCVNVHPHITVSCCEGTKPVESNTILERLYAGEEFQTVDVDFDVHGHCDLFVKTADGGAKWVTSA